MDSTPDKSFSKYVLVILFIKKNTVKVFKLNTSLNFYEIILPAVFLKWFKNGFTFKFSSIFKFLLEMKRKDLKIKHKKNILNKVVFVYCNL